MDIKSSLPEIIENAACSVLILDRDGRLLFVNRASANVLRIKAEDLPGGGLEEVLGLDQAKRFGPRLHSVVDQQEAKAYEEEVDVPSGRRWYHSLLTPVLLPGQESHAVMVVATDVTERKLAETALERRVRFEELIADMSSEFLNVSDGDLAITTDRMLQRLGEFMEVDRTLLFEMTPDQSELLCVNEWAATGIKPAKPGLQGHRRAEQPWIFKQLIAGELTAISHLDDLPAEASAIRDVLQNHGVQSMVSIPLHFGGRCVGALCLDSPVSGREWSEQILSRLKVIGNIVAHARERLRAERELAASRSFIEGVIAASPHICFVFDLDREAHLFVNSQITPQLGFTVDEVLKLGDQFITQMVHPDDQAVVYEVMQQSKALADSQLLEFESRFLHADGRWLWLRSHVKVFHRAPDGHVDQVIGWSEDITQRKWAEEELRRRHAELARVDRVNTLGEMVTGVAHELSQPLYAIRNFVNAARNVIDQRPDQVLQEASDWLRHAGSAADSAGVIIQRLRAFARGTQHLQSDVAVKELIAGALSLMQFEFQHRQVRVLVDPVPESYTVHVDRVQIQQVLVNLLHNACEAMETCDPGEARISIGTHVHDGQIEFFVSDRGVGLPSDETNIFSPFVTTKPEGLGLGLAISKTIIEDHGGELWPERNIDAGATFRFVLPMVSD